MATEEESFAKFTLGPEVSKNCPKALGLPWDFENDVIHFNFEKKSHRLKSHHCLHENVVPRVVSG